MEPADATFARGVHERVLNALHLIMIGQSNAAVITATLQWIDEPRGPGAHSTDACLADVLQDAVQRSGVTGVDIACPQEADSAVSPQAAEALSAAIVEALRNAQRHAQASQVSVRAEWHADGIHVEVRDDGRGFDAQASPRLGLALGITRSMAGVGGSAQIRSDTGHGTVVQLSLGTPSAHPTAEFADGHLVSEWPRVAAGARRLMADLLASQIDAHSPGICDQSRIEDARIRIWLDSARVDSWMARQVAVAVGHAADRGRRVTAAITGSTGISATLDVDLAAAVTGADAIMLSVEPGQEELLAIFHSDAELQLDPHPELSWRVEQVGAGLRGLRINRSR